jgi:hypothetical protein
MEDFYKTDYATVAASQTDQVLSTKAGSILEKLIVIPATTGAGNISIKDGATAISVFATGTLTNLQPFLIPLGIRAVGAGFKITTGANVSVIAVGRFI